MSPEKEEAVRQAARRAAHASVKVKYMREMNTPSDPDLYVKMSEDYRVALAELNEAEAELARVSRAEFQLTPKTGE